MKVSGLDISMGYVENCSMRLRLRSPAEEPGFAPPPGAATRRAGLRVVQGGRTATSSIVNRRFRI